MLDPLDIVGVKYKNIEVVSYLPKGQDNRHYYKCVCQDCGREQIKQRRYVIQENGCISCIYKKCNKNATPKYDKPEYSAWKKMKNRCNDPKDKSYKNYGGRGIEVCDEWLNSFKKFYEDMGPRPSKRHSLDRRNNEGNYEPSNCRWATTYEQQRNRRNNVLNQQVVREIKRLKVEEKLGATAIAKRLGVKVANIRNVLSGNCWTDVK